MSNKFKAHFDKNLQWYSFGILLLMAVMMAYLFLRVDSFDTEVSRYELRHEETAARKAVNPPAPEVLAPENGALDPALFDPALDPALLPPEPGL